MPQDTLIQHPTRADWLAQQAQSMPGLQTPGVLPLQSPVQSSAAAPSPATPPPADWEGVYAGAVQQLLPTIMTALGGSEEARQREESLRAEMRDPRNIPQPYKPKFEKITGGKTLLRDVGRGLAAAAIDNPWVLPTYEHGARERQAGLVKQLSALQAERAASVGGAQAAGTAMGGMGRMLVGVGSEKRGEASLTAATAAVRNAETNAANIASQISARLVQQKQRWEELSYQDRMTTLHEMLDPIRAEAMRQMSLNPQAVAQIAAQAHLSGINVVTQAGMIRQPGMWAMIADWSNGLLTLPAAPQAPGGAAPIGAGIPPAGGAQPPRPKGVPPNATWNPQARQWQINK